MSTKDLWPLSERSGIYVYESSQHHDCVEVYIGPIHDNESDHVTTIHKEYLPALVAALMAAMRK